MKKEDVMKQRGVSNIAVIAMVIGIAIIGIGSYLVFSTGSKDAEEYLQDDTTSGAEVSQDAIFQESKEDNSDNTISQEQDAPIIQGQVIVSFRDNVTKDDAIVFFENLDLTVNEEFIKPVIQFREFSYPSSRLADLFLYLEDRSLVNSCVVIGEYPQEEAVNADCTFRNNFSERDAVQALQAYPELGLSTDQPVPPVIYWSDPFFLNRIVVPVPPGSEREWEAKLSAYPEIASVSVVPLTQLPVPPDYGE